MHAFNLQAQPLSLAERLADFAVEALIDEGRPVAPSRRWWIAVANGAHTDLHLGLMHASALSLWPMFKEMAEAAYGGAPQTSSFATLNNCHRSITA